MTSAELMSVYNNSNEIGTNVFNFFFDTYKKYEPFFVIKPGKLTDPGNDLIERTDLIDWVKNYTPEKAKYYKKFDLIKAYDEVVDRMTWKDLYAFHLTNGFTTIDCERYDFKTLKSETENICSIVDRTNGERLYFMTDQTERFYQYNYNEQCYEINPDTGESEKVYINKDVDKLGTDKHRIQMNYHD